MQKTPATLSARLDTNLDRCRLQIIFYSRLQNIISLRAQKDHEIRDRNSIVCNRGRKKHKKVLRLSHRETLTKVLFVCCVKLNRGSERADINQNAFCKVSCFLCRDAQLIAIRIIWATRKTSRSCNEPRRLSAIKVFQERAHNNT